MRRRYVGAVVRWGLAAAIVGAGAWRLASTWAELEVPALVHGPERIALASVVGATALVVLALLSAAGVRAADLPPPIAGRSGAPPRFWPMWVRVWLQAYFFRYVPGKVMLVVERVRLGERLGVSRAASLVLVVWESLLLVAGAGVVAGVGLMALPANPDAPVSRVAVAVLAIVAVAASILLMPVLRLGAAAIPALRARVPGLVLAVPTITQLALVLGYGVAWLLLGGSFAFTVRAFEGGQDTHVTLLVCWFVASYVAGQVSSVTPAGLGVREALLVAGLSATLPAPVALAAAVAHRILLSLVELVVLGASLTIRLPEGTPAADATPAGEGATVATGASIDAAALPGNPENVR